MGRLKKGHNWKARIQPTVTNSETISQPQMKPDVVIENGITETEYKSVADETNLLVITGKKGKSKDVKVQLCKF